MPHCIHGVSSKEKKGKVYAFQLSHQEPPKAAAQSMVCHGIHDRLLTGDLAHAFHPMLKVDEMLKVLTEDV